MLKYLALLLIVCVCSSYAQIIRSNYVAGQCSTSASSLYSVAIASSQCLTGSFFPFNNETRLYSCSGNTISYETCTDGSCSSCSNSVQVDESTCIAWNTNDHSDQLSCGTTIPSTQTNTPYIAQYNGQKCSGSLEFGGAYSNAYCTASGEKYSCNNTAFAIYNCTSAGCGNCSLIKEMPLTSGIFCDGYTQYVCVNSGAGTLQPSTTGAGSTTSSTQPSKPTAAPGSPSGTTGESSGAGITVFSVVLSAVLCVVYIL